MECGCRNGSRFPSTWTSGYFLLLAMGTRCIVPDGPSAVLVHVTAASAWEGLTQRNTWTWTGYTSRERRQEIAKTNGVCLRSFRPGLTTVQIPLYVSWLRSWTAATSSRFWLQVGVCFRQCRTRCYAGSPSWVSYVKLFWETGAETPRFAKTRSWRSSLSPTSTVTAALFQMIEIQRLPWTKAPRRDL